MTDYKDIKYRSLVAGDIPNLAGSKITSGTVDNARITLDAAEIPSLATSKITSGTFADARLSASSVTQHATTYDDTDLRSDIMTLALKEAITENRIAYNLPNAMIEQFQDDSKIGTETTVDRNSSEYVETVAAWTVDTNTALETSLVGHYEFDNSLADRTNTNNLTNHVNSITSITGSSSFSTSEKKLGTHSGKMDNPDSAFALNGGTPSWGSLTNLSLACWVYWTGGHGTGAASEILHGSGYQRDPAPTFNIRINDYDDKAQVQMVPNSSGSGELAFTPTSTTITKGAWTHLGFAITPSTIKFYINGSLDTTHSGLSYDLGDANAEFRLYGLNNHLDNGAWSTSGGYHGNDGYFDQTLIWTKEVSAQEITDLYNSGSGNVYNTFSATGTLISTAQTANAAQTKVSGVILYKNNAGTATLGTDLKIYFTCNGGTNWTESTPTAAGTFSSGILMAKCPEVTCTSGTDIRYKAVWANQASSSKETRLYGIGVNY